MAVFSTIVDSGIGLDEDMLDVEQLRDLGLCHRIAAQLVGHDLARRLGASSQHSPEKPFGSRLVATLLQQNIELDAMLIDCSPQQIRLAAQRNEHFVKVPSRARLATRSLNTMRKARAEFIAPAPDCFVTDDHSALKQQLFNVAQAQRKAKIPAYSATDDGSREAVA